MLAPLLAVLATALHAPAQAQTGATQPPARYYAAVHRHAPAKHPATCRARPHHPCPKPKPRKRTPPPPRPSVATGVAAAVTGSGATLTGTVAPNGHAAAYWIDYGLTTRYGTHSPHTATRTARGGRPVSIAVSRLAPLSTYHFRLVASSCRGCRGGTGYGKDASFTTGGYQNPVWGSDEAPDPDVLDNGGTHHDYWDFNTGELFPILHSTDLVHWTYVGTAMTQRPTWALQSGDWHPWAPNVVQRGGACPGTSSAVCYVMYYVGVNAHFGFNCVAVATSPTPGGPYTDQGPLSNGTLDAGGRPIGCGDNNGYGMIDPSFFVDPRTGQPYLYGSEDFACPLGSASCTAADSHLAPTISVIPLSSDLLHGAGPRTPLFGGDPDTWEDVDVLAPTVEGPTAIYHNGLYYLLYSGSSWHTSYGMGYAIATSPAGPFVKSSANPIFAQTATVLSPGGGDTPVSGPHGGMWMLYHARAGSYADNRTLRLDPFYWRAAPPGPDVPVIGGPTSNPQPFTP